MKDPASHVVQRTDPLGELLVRRKIITEKELKNALVEQGLTGVSLGKILVKEGILSRDDLNRVVADANGMEFVSLDPGDIDPAVAHLVPVHVVKQYRAIPVRIEGKNLFVAMDSPLNLAARDEISLQTGYRVVPLVTTQKELTLVIRHHFSIEDATKQEIANIRLRETEDSRAKPDNIIIDEPPEGAEGAVIRLVDSIINSAVAAKASDIHLEPQEPEMRVRYRVDGILNDIMTIPWHVEPSLVSRIKIMADLDISERRSPQDGHFPVAYDGKEYDLRVSTMPTVTGEKVVIRVLDKGSTIVNLDSLGFSSDDKDVFESFITHPFGMVLVTGPTGSGKTTTLYTVLRSLNSEDRNIVSVEDPVEYSLSGINQVQINPAADITFPKALRTILRQDPDIIMVGEIRDSETAELAVHAALTGHLVFSTLHTNDAAGAIVRLVEMGVEPFLIASSLIGVVAQRLVRTICPDCREVYEPSKSDLAEFHADVLPKGLELSRGKGCRFCYQTGYRGRTGVYEILRVSENIRGLVISKRSTSVIREAATDEGMKTLLQRGLDKIMEGASTLAEIRRVIGKGMV